MKKQTFKNILTAAAILLFWFFNGCESVISEEGSFQLLRSSSTKVVHFSADPGSMTANPFENGSNLDYVVINLPFYADSVLIKVVTENPKALISIINIGESRGEFINSIKFPGNDLNYYKMSILSEDGKRQKDYSIYLKFMTPSSVKNIYGYINQNSEAILKWNTIENVDGYIIYKTKTLDESFFDYSLFSLIGKVKREDFIDTDIEAGRKYTYRILTTYKGVTSDFFSSARIVLAKWKNYFEKNDISQGVTVRLNDSPFHMPEIVSGRHNVFEKVSIFGEFNPINREGYEGNDTIDVDNYEIHLKHADSLELEVFGEVETRLLEINYFPDTTIVNELELQELDTFLVLNRYSRTISVPYRIFIEITSSDDIAYKVDYNIYHSSP